MFSPSNIVSFVLNNDVIVSIKFGNACGLKVESNKERGGWVDFKEEDAKKKS